MSARLPYESDKYQSSLTDPLDGTVLCRELNDYCDKLVDERRSSEVLSTYDDGPVYDALSTQLSRAKLIARFDDRYTEAKFSKSEVWDKVPEGSTLIFGDTRISF